jgi:Fur family ferric uptake transcriptional regulator
MVDVDCAAGEAPCLTAADEMGYEIDEAEVAYWGRCPDCAARVRTPSGANPPMRRRERQLTPPTTTPTKKRK